MAFTEPAKKSLAQHFLHERGIVARIVQAVDPQPGDCLVEIGPGQGAITFPLLDRHGELTAVMGPSGAGKSTFLAALSGRAGYGTIRGEVRLNGKVDSLARYEFTRFFIFVLWVTSILTGTSCIE